MEQVLFAVLVLAVGLIRVIMSAAEKKRNQEAAKRSASQRQQANAPVQRAPTESEEERVRKFFEALGVPTNVPPPKTPPRTVLPKTPRPPRRTIRPIDPFPAPRADVPPRPVATPPPIIAAAPAPTPPPVITTEPQPTVTAPATPTFEVHDVRFGREAPRVPSPTGATSTVVRQDVVAAEPSWAVRLATSESLRDAIVLREIFGPPRSVQPFTGDEFA